MSFDMFVQRFGDLGDVPAMDPGAFHAVFGPHIDRAEPEYGFLRLRTRDGGSADIYARMTPALDSVMINHISRGKVLDLVVEFARTVDAVILPVGCSSCVVDIHQIPRLPEPLRANVCLVTSGAGLEAAITQG